MGTASGPPRAIDIARGLLYYAPVRIVGVDAV
jgi:hypothetical protein